MRWGALDQTCVRHITKAAIGEGEIALNMYIKHVELYVKKPCVCACAYTNIYNILHHICDCTGAWMYVYVCVSEGLNICMHCA